MLEAQPLHQLAGQVESLISALEDLMSDLEREHEALASRYDAEALRVVAEVKANAVDRVAALYDSLRETLLRTMGETADGRLDAALDALRTMAPALAARVEHLARLTEQCQQANRRNGVLVSAGLSNTQGAMRTLQALVRGGDAVTYGRRGEAESGSANDYLALRA